MINVESLAFRVQRLVSICLLFSVGCLHAQTPNTKLSTLNTQQESLNKPWTFWYWMYGAVSKEGIKADLQAMKDVGLGGCYLMPIRGINEKPEYHGEAQQLAPKFWEMVDYAMQQADSLQLDLGIHICDGFALAGGPWISPEESMQKVVWSDTIIHVTKKNQAIPLPQPAQGYEGYYEDIAAFAIRAENPLPQPHETGTIIRDDKGVFHSKEAGYIQFDFDKPQTVRSLEIIPSGNNVQAQRLLVQASENGETFYDVRQLTPPRQGWQNTDENYTYSIPKTTSKHFRFYWTPKGTEPGSEDLDAAKWSPVLKVKDIILSPEPRTDQYEAKNGSVWRIVDVGSRNYEGGSDLSKEVRSLKEDEHHTSIPQNCALRTTSSIILPPSSFDFHSSFTPGPWRIIRFGHTSTGHTNATGGGGKGLECDKFSAEAVEKQIDHWFGEFMKRPHANVIKYMHVDSWECGSQNWSKNFLEEFKNRRGYDLLPFMPVYAGIPMKNDEQVLYDIRLTINELIHDVFFATVKKKADSYGVLLSSESVAPTMVSDGMEHYKYADVPMGEYWLNSPTHDKSNDMLDAISGAHIYGKNIVQAEGFTEVRGVWDETPAMIKPLLDRNFALGMNRLFFHVFTHNPWMDRKPGMTLDGIGLFFQRDQTWFPEAKAFVDYITRCQRLLQEGKPVVDIAVFTGEEMPNRSIRPEQLIDILPGLIGIERVEKERKRMENIGQPMEESPVGVNHSANIVDPKDWVNALNGYQYDSMNKDALLHSDNAFKYSVFVIPQNVIVSPETQERINALRQQGVIIIDKPLDVDSIQGLVRDINLPKDIAYCHRVNGNRHIYFISNQTDEVNSFPVTFRNGGDNPIIYYPMNDMYSPAKYYTSDKANASTKMNLCLNPYESVFVIFDKEMPPYPIPVTSCLHQKRPKGKPSWKQVKDWTLTLKENVVSIHTDTLFDWSKHTNDSIRYFSGHARYSTVITCKKSDLKNAPIILSLGEVHDIAHVWVNGIDCGIAWMAPYELDISQALKKGKNNIEIEITNTWHNALRGADEGKAPYDGIWTNAKYRTKGNDLLPSGLLGPITLKIKDER